MQPVGSVVHFCTYIPVVHLTLFKGSSVTLRSMNWLLFCFCCVFFVVAVSASFVLVVVFVCFVVVRVVVVRKWN